jgi:hypothetical protein
MRFVELYSCVSHEQQASVFFTLWNMQFSQFTWNQRDRYKLFFCDLILCQAVNSAPSTSDADYCVKNRPFSPLICMQSLSIPCNPLGLSPVIGYSMHDQDNPCCNQFSSILVSWEKLMFFCGLHHKLYRAGLSSGDLRTLMLWCKTEVEKFTMNLSDHISRQKANMGT